MESRVLDPKTLGAVVAASPIVRGRPEMLARQILKVIIQEMEGQSSLVERVERKGVSCFTARVIDLATPMGDATGHMTGHILGEMGLQKVRTNDGYHVFWNDAQVEILREALGVSNPE